MTVLWNRRTTEVREPRLLHSTGPAPKRLKYGLIRGTGPKRPKNGLSGIPR